MINDGAINSVQINSLSENSVYVVESVLNSDTRNTTSSLKDKIIEPLTYKDVEIFKSSLKNAIIEDFSFLNKLAILLKGLISENVNLTNTNLGNSRYIQVILDKIKETEQIVNTSFFSNYINEIFYIYDFIFKIFQVLLNEDISLTDIESLSSKRLEVLLSNIALTDTSAEHKVYLLSLQEKIIENNLLTTKQKIKEILSEGFVISISNAKDRDTYLAYLLSPESMSVVNYDNYNFDGCTKFNGKYLFCNSTGLYERGGELDNNFPVDASFTTAAYDFSTSNLKSVPLVYLGVTSDDAVYLKVRVDGKKEAIYKLNKFTENLQTQKFPLSKGIIGRYFQFELVTSANTFSLESIEFYPLIIKRKL